MNDSRIPLTALKWIWQIHDHWGEQGPDRQREKTYK